MGRGVALVLGEEGATVCVPDRNIRGEATGDLPRATIEDTAAMVIARAGMSIPYAATTRGDLAT